MFRTVILRPPVLLWSLSTSHLALLAHSRKHRAGNSFVITEFVVQSCYPLFLEYPVLRPTQCCRKNHVSVANRCLVHLWTQKFQPFWILEACQVVFVSFPNV